MRRLTGDEHLNAEFATTWPTYDLDVKTRALLAYASRLTETPSAVDDADFATLRDAGWDQAAIDHATTLIAFFNFSGRLEAASGLPLDTFPPEVTYPEGNPAVAP